MIEPASELHELLFCVRRSVRYHVRRRKFFERFNLAVQALAVIFGSATIYAVLGQLGEAWAIGAAAVVTVTSAVNLVVDTPRLARLHYDLARRFIELEREIVGADAQDGAALRRWQAQRLEIETEEPPVLHVLNAICHNELARAMGYPREELARIGPLQRLFAHLFDWREHRIA